MAKVPLGHGRVSCRQRWKLSLLHFTCTVACVPGNTKWPVSEVGGSFWSQDVRGARRKWCQVLRREQCHHIGLRWVSTCHTFFCLYLNQNIYWGLLQEIKGWLRIQTRFLITRSFQPYCKRTDLSQPRATQHSRSYKHFPWTHFLSPGKSVSQATQFLEFQLRRCWEGVGKDARWWRKVNRPSLRAIWGEKIKVRPYKYRLRSRDLHIWGEPSAMYNRERPHHDSPILVPLSTTYTPLPEGLLTNFLHPGSWFFHTGPASEDSTLNTGFREKRQLWVIAVWSTERLPCPRKWQKAGDSPISPGRLTPCHALTERWAATGGIPDSCRAVRETSTR